MKLLLLKILLQRRARDDGYVLPMVMAIGLVMLLLGAVNLTSAKEESFNAITKNSRADALGIAEVGIAQYREMLDRNRILTIYNRDQWTSNNVNGVDVAGQTCDVITNTLNGWASREPTGTAFNEANWRAVTLDETIINRDLNDDGDATDNAVNIGWFKIVDYEYDIDGNIGDANNDGVIDDTDDNGVFSIASDANTADDPLPNPPGPSVPVNSITDENDTDDNGTSDARGILTVKSRTPDGSEAQIQVDIPIRINDLNNLAPVLWIASSAITEPGILNFPNSNNENIILTNAGVNCATPGAVAGNTNIINDPRGLPPIIDDPAGVAAANRNILGTVDNSTGGNLLLPRPLAIPDNQTVDGERFLYDINNSLTISGNDLLTDGVAKVSLYVRNTLDITNTGGTLRIGNFDPTTSNVSSHNLEIYCDGSVSEITIDTGSGGDITNIEALIHAPNSLLRVTGSGELFINGALWVNDIDNTGSGTITIQGDQTDTTTGSETSYKFYTTSANRTPRPLTASPTNWKTEEVN